jgi:hypothetical protein
LALITALHWNSVQSIFGSISLLGYPYAKYSDVVSPPGLYLVLPVLVKVRNWKFFETIGPNISPNKGCEKTTGYFFFSRWDDKI